MGTNRRKFIRKSLLLGGGAFFAGYVLSKNKPLATQAINRSIDNSADATYKNTKHNRQFYSVSRF